MILTIELKLLDSFETVLAISVHFKERIRNRIYESVLGLEIKLQHLHYENIHFNSKEHICTANMDESLLGASSYKRPWSSGLI